MEQRKTVTIEEKQKTFSKSSLGHYTLVTNEDGVWLQEGSPPRPNTTQLIDKDGFVALGGAGRPSKLIAAAYKEWRRWVKDHPPGVRICEGWYLLPQPEYPGSREWFGSRKYAKGPQTDVYLDYYTDQENRIRIESKFRTLGKSAPVSVVAALMQAELKHHQGE